MFELSEEHRMLKDLVAKFVDQELIPLERQVLAREAAGGKAGLADSEEERILARCKELGLWSLDVPEELGGANLPAVALMAMNEELGRCAFPFTFPPDSPNLHMLLAVASPEQRKKYLEPYAAGTAKSAIAISEPGAGGRPRGDDHAGGARRRRLGDQRAEDLGEPGAAGGLRDRDGADRRGEAARGGDGVHRGARREGVHH
jgi:acyl-CoA dehydrogenase